jgi:hypothetical protein
LILGISNFSEWDESMCLFLQQKVFQRSHAKRLHGGSRGRGQQGNDLAGRGYDIFITRRASPTTIGELMRRRPRSRSNLSGHFDEPAENPSPADGF